MAVGDVLRVDEVGELEVIALEFKDTHVLLGGEVTKVILLHSALVHKVTSPASCVQSSC